MISFNQQQNSFRTSNNIMCITKIFALSMPLLEASERQARAIHSANSKFLVNNITLLQNF